MRMTASLMLLALTFLLALTACQAKQTFPDPFPGWHSADYGIVFGRLQRVAAKKPEDPPVWVIRYGYTDSDKYSGKFNLTPPTKLVGFNNGDLIRVTGTIRPEYVHPEFAGTWYQIESIRLWSGYQGE